MKYHKQTRKRGIGQEDRMQIQFGQLIAKYEAIGKLNAIWWTYMPIGEYRLINTAVMLKKKGVKSGMSDYLFIYYQGDQLNLIWLEFKSQSGKQTPNQIKFQERINKYKNSVYIIVRSVEEAIKVLEVYKILITS